ncbi:hypothetical protein MBLNU459_g2572t1 [Dothideomycetes sp. NU459]
MAIGQEDVYCTLVMSDSYLPGAAVLAHSLRDNGAKKKLAVLITTDSLRASTVTELKSLYDYVIPVERIGTPSPSNLHLMNRSDLLYTFTKISLWRQTQFRKIVYIDADVVALRAPDELFDTAASFAAAPDVGWPDAFNTGVMVVTPHMGDFWALKTLAATGDSFDGADQGLLNQYYEHKDWQRLSFTYNCTPSANYQYEPAYRYHKARISMVHFIGKNKPWMTSRSKYAAPGAYNELLSRWWAVYDRHLREPVADYTSGLHTPEPDLANSGEPAENLAQGVAEPTPASEQRQFSAPSMEWDATRDAPPSDARPEAANFPSQTYVFNQDPELFKAPSTYPEPPKDMWYDVPKVKPAPPEVRPPPIFPWEERPLDRPTRKFAEDLSSPNPTPALNTSTGSGSQSNVPPTPTIKVTSDDDWNSFNALNKNAWDQVSGIDQYVRALAKAQKTRGKVQVLTPGAEPSPQSTQFERRESLILTDFPSSVDRPSLPVTPAPMRRPNFWGEERNAAGQLPSAEGVPNQADWDPNMKLEELRKNSLIAPGDVKPTGSVIPDRQMPTSAVTVPEGASSPTKTSPSGSPSPSTVPASGVSAGQFRPQFGSVDFAMGNGSAGEDVLSPTEHGSRHF